MVCRNPDCPDYKSLASMICNRCKKARQAGGEKTVDYILPWDRSYTIKLKSEIPPQDEVKLAFAHLEGYAKYGLVGPTVRDSQVILDYLRCMNVREKEMCCRVTVNGVDHDVVIETLSQWQLVTMAFGNKYVAIDAEFEVYYYMKNLAGDFGLGEGVVSKDKSVKVLPGMVFHVNAKVKNG